MLVLHYTGMRSGEAALERLCDPAAKVSAHYLVAENGDIYAMVAEADRAWHAGVSFWAGATDINALSIGIELVNPGHEFGYRPFPEPQMAAAIALCRDIVQRHAIPAHRVLGHSDVAPARKQDPGELFDWQRLAAAGIGVWPDEDRILRPSETAGEWPELLAAVGYDVVGAGLAACVTAFQRHWRPARVDGVLDDDCLGRLRSLLDLMPRRPDL